MKKRVISALMLSTVLLSASAGLTSVSADSTEDKLKQQENVIANAQSEKEKAQAQIDQIQSNVDSLQAKQEEAKKRFDVLAKESKEISAQIVKINEDIKKRTTSLEAQARSAQVNNSATGYIDAVLSSESLTDALQKVTAMATVANANKDMIKQQQADEKALKEKQEDNNKKYDEASKLERDLSEQKKELDVEQAQLKSAKLNYQATITNAQGEKDKILKEKAAADAAAKALADAQKQEQERIQKAQDNNTIVGSTGGGVVNTGDNSSSGNQNQENNVVTPPSNGGTTGGNVVTPPSTPPVNNTPAGSNPFPWGQCTWGVWQIKGGNMPTYAGNAADWAVYANSTKPTPGAIAVFPPGNQGAGGFGHVGVVVSVEGSTFTIQETNYGGTDGIIKTRSGISAAGVSFIA